MIFTKPNKLQKFIYFLHDKKIQFIIGILLILFAFSYPVKAETIIYDNISISQYKFITLDEFQNIPFIDNGYEYPVLFDGKFVGNYKITDKIFYPDNINITIILPSPIKTSTDDIYVNNIKPMMFNMIGFLLTWGLLLIVIVYIIYRIIRKIWKGY